MDLMDDHAMRKLKRRKEATDVRQMLFPEIQTEAILCFKS